MYKFLLPVILIFYQGGSLAAGIIQLPENISLSLNREYDPSLSPNGKYVAYSVESNGDENIWLLDLEAGEKRQITFHSASDYSPGFLGNSKILFVSRRGNSLGEIYVSDVNGKKRELIIGGEGYYNTPAASKNKKRIAYVHGEINDSVFIYIYDLKRKNKRRGPPGLDPSFFRSGDSLVFVSTAANGNANKIAIYNLVDSSIAYLETGTGLHLNPIVLNTGNAILFENKSWDTNGDGKITISDDSNLMIFDLNSNTLKRILPGFIFSNPAISENNKMCAQGDDENIYIIPHNGLTDKEPDYEKQYELCDSLIKYSLSFYDSLVAAVVCYEAYYYYPEYCRNLILRSALIYSKIGKHDMALDILTEINKSADSLFKCEIQLTEAKIRYQIYKISEYLKEKIKSITMSEDLLKNEGLPDSLVKEVYRFCIELYFNEKMYDDGRILIEDGIGRFNDDNSFLAILERWDLKYLVNIYAGDINDLIPLYIELIEKYKLQSKTDEILVRDLIELLTGMASGNVLDELEKLRNNYEWHPLLSGMASLEQARILSRQNRRSLAEWRLKEISEKYLENPELRFAVFNQLFDLYIDNEEYSKAAIMIDSASAYLDFINDHYTGKSFKMKAAEFYVYSGYEKLQSDAVEAQKLFAKALSHDSNNFNAIWGLAKAGYDGKKRKNYNDTVSLSVSRAGLAYLRALSHIVNFEKEKKLSYLEKARGQLIKIMERYPSYPLSYLSAGYAACLLEENSKKPLGLYEEAVEYSFKGISLIKNDKDLAFGFYLNLGEAYFGLGQYNEAYIYYKMAKEIDPALEDDIKFLIKYGESALHIDSLDIAKEYFQALYNKSSDSGNEKTKAFGALKLGLINQMLGNYIEAAEYYEVARQYYNARKDGKAITDIFKAQAFCLKMTGEDKTASTYADKAQKSFRKTRYKGARYDNRVKFILWPFGINIPLIELLPMRFGGSLYPKGFTSAAEEAFLLEMLDESKDIISDISLKNNQIEILNSSDEEQNTVDLWDNLGIDYHKIGYTDSSAAAFKKAHKLCMDLEEYHGAYIELLNWAEALFDGYSASDFTAILKELEEIKSRALDLYDHILPSYPNARANLKNIVGLAEYITGVIETGSILANDYTSIQNFLKDLNNDVDEIHNRFSRARYYYREALTELTPGEYPDIETGLLLNDAITSYSLGDFDGVNSSLKSAKNTAILSGSARLYARVAGLDAIINQNGNDNYIRSLEDAVRLYENMPVGQGHTADMPFLEALYERIVEYYINDRDAYRSIYYLESLKKLKLVSQFNRIHRAFYKSERFKANLNLLKNYQNNLIDLNMEKIRLEALGVVGKVRLREVNEKILKIRSRILELRPEIKELDPAAYSSLVFDPMSVKSLIERIPKDEVCIIAHKISKEIAIWICGDNSLDLLFLNDPDKSENTGVIEDISDYKIVTISSPNDIYEKLKNIINKKYPGVAIKRAYSLNEAYKTDIRDIRRIDGILIVRFDGYVLTDSLADALGADLVGYNSTFSKRDLSKYGWIIFDGKLVEERRNFLLSYLNGEIKEDDGKTAEKLYLKDLPGMANNAFGVLFIDSAGKVESRNEGILLNLIENMGAEAVLIIDDIQDKSVLELSLKTFFDELMFETPIKSYSKALNPERNIDSDKYGLKVTYYGENGWSINEEDLKIKNLFSEYVLIGNQYYIQKYWEAAEKYYNLAFDIVINRNFDDLSRAHVAGKLIKTYENSGEYHKKIEVCFSRFVDVFGRAKDLKQMAKIYKDMAKIKYDKSEYQESIEYSNVLIDIAGEIKDISSKASGYAIRGKALLETGELDKARADLSKSIELFLEDNNEKDALWSGLDMVEIYNLKETYGKSKITLDSLKISIDKVPEKKMYYKYLIQMSKYYIGTFRNESAKKHLEYIISEDKNNAEAAILLGKIYLMRGDLDSAFAFAQKGLSNSKIGKIILLLMESNELLGDIYRAKGMKEESLLQYNLARDVITNYKYKKFSDLLKYKSALVADVENGKRDSLYNEIISGSETEYVKDLSWYQLGYGAVMNKDRERARNYFESILESNDKKTLRYLRWRALYNLALIAEKENKLQYLKSAEQFFGNYSIEPDYIKDAYGLHESRADLYSNMADIMINEKELKSAINYLETGYSKRVSGRYFSIGNLDSTENSILNHMSIDEIESNHVEFKGDRFKVIRDDLKYGVLWGERPVSVEELQGSLRENESVLRFYSADSNFIVTYVDRDSIFVHEYDFNEGDLSESLMKMVDLLANQQTADSVMEKWYIEIVSPVERYLEDTEKILIVPDGMLHIFPFETLKMPEGDYLSEMFTLKRHMYLPVKFPADSNENMTAVPDIGETYNPDISLIQYVVEPFSKPLQDTDNCVKFYQGSFSFFDGSSEKNSGIVCMVKPFSGDDHLNLVLQAIMSVRDGNVGFVYPLWDMSDEIKAAFYWKFLKNLADGKGFWNSYNESRSYIFGHYDGFPDTWGAIVYMSLN